MYFIYILKFKSTNAYKHFLICLLLEYLTLYACEEGNRVSHLEMYTIDEMTKARTAVPRTTETTTTASRLPGNTHTNKRVRPSSTDCHCCHAGNHHSPSLQLKPDSPNPHLKEQTEYCGYCP